jgi:hypothetical protein
VQQPADAEILFESGDPLGAGAFRFAPASRVNSRGAGFSAITSLDTSDPATSSRAARRSSLGADLWSFRLLFLPQPLSPAPPAINDHGVVAFLWRTRGRTKVRRPPAAS